MKASQVIALKTAIAVHNYSISKEDWRSVEVFVMGGTLYSSSSSAFCTWIAADHTSSADHESLGRSRFTPRHQQTWKLS